MSLKNTHTRITSTEFCLTLIDLVRIICKFQNYEEQYKFSTVSDVLKNIIIDHVWRFKFKEVEIRIYSENDFIVTNKIYDNKLCDAMMFLENLNKYNKLATNGFHRNAKELDLFLHLNRNNIQKLKIEAQNDIRASFPLKEELKNLQYLHANGIQMTNVDLKYLGNKCKTIESLILFRCYYPPNNSVLTNENGMQIIETLPNLKKLKLSKYGRLDYEFSNLTKMVNQLKLQQLSLNYDIVKYNSEECPLNYHKVRDYTDFQIDIRCLEASLYFQRHFLTNFKNLSNLCIRTHTVNDGFFNILLKSCENLKQLSLNCCKIENVIALPKLCEIFMRYCRGLTYRHLKTMLNEMNLKSFSLIRCHIEGNLEAFPISQTLVCFKVVSVVDNIKTGQLFENSKLLKLIKLHLDIFGDENQDISLKFAPNLQYLYINPSSLNVKEFLELKCLRKLVLINYYPCQLSKLQQLLQHEHLVELSILNCLQTRSYNNPNNSGEIKTVTKNLRYFNIPKQMMTHEDDFVLDLLNVNKKLSLKCCERYGGCTTNATFIRNILLNEKFPKHFKSVNICGLSMDCASLRDESSKYYKLFRFFKRDFYFTLENVL